MENFIVSARKYRPATFSMVVGQDAITNTLKNAIKGNHLAQAYLFCGPRGVGKTTCARIFAKTINCSNIRENGDPCDECESCLSFNTLRSFNIHELDAASNNKVEDIRSLNDQIRIPPQIGKYSIYIIDEVHMLSSSAFNAFLKTLEEPPAHAIFILATTEKHKIIPTILSRCQIFDFNRIKIEDIVNRLIYVAKNESVSAEEEALHIIAQKADGALRDALSIFDQLVSLCGKKIIYKDVIENLNVLDYEYYFKIVGGALRNNLSTLLVTFNEILEKGFDGHNFISGLNSHLRDLLVSKDESTLRLLETTPSVRQRYAQQSAECPVSFLYKALEIGSNCDITYKNSKNPRLHVELALIQMCRITSESNGDQEKKKPEAGQLNSNDEVIPVPSKSEIVRQTEDQEKKAPERNPRIVSKHQPHIEKEVRSFSIREVISASDEPKENSAQKEASVHNDITVNAESREDLTADSLSAAWQDFINDLKGESPRIISMFKSVKPDLEEDNTIKIHLTNAAQKDIFIQNYKQKLSGFLHSRFKVNELEIETSVDLSEDNEILYTDEQKYNYLQSKYPDLKEFRKAFNLDIS
ncbi:MAG TPA: DNA polymerase III subunit gamma/tau [Bacteroidales bacterium]|jgi:DNA polymerase-3 subunit gamma/tau|nr:DNA polymerase III subunit gamma/tau [Bacteroidales bacterium]OQB65528.1 MAG: DNA polymerase III subunit tau [Bacteroidetes bacterium ADurb.Bin145]HOU01068.1 DNA polymerase III subunit gamma/tau [Bacteroidales bacterium]HQG62645.1 DNA polymerase III subunit gamma/tau [Bacteroidales bacterium]HQK68395.1 DNA polymerase III subunit gamma/tau [Bacteroidales bacterium]